MRAAATSASGAATSSPRTSATARSSSARGCEHDEWGSGTVGQVEDGQVTVVFDTVGYKTLGVDLVVERGLLEVE